MAEPKAVLFVTHDASRTRAAMLLLHLLRWLRRDGRLPFAVLVKRSGPEPMLSALVPDFRAVGPTFVLDPGEGSGGWRGRVANALRVRRLVRWAKAHHVGLVHSNTITNGDIAGVFQRLGCPVVTHVHELEFYASHVVHPDALTFVKKTTARYVACSRAVADYLVRAHDIPGAKVSVHHEFIHTADWDGARDRVGRAEARTRLGVPDDAVVVVGAGTTDWRKGIDVFVRVAAAAVRRHPKVWCVWVGGQADGIARAEFDTARLGVKDRVKWAGTVKDPATYFAAGDVFALTSREDPYPLVMLEAAASALPVVCFAESGGAPEFVTPDVGAVVPYLDAGAMADALVRLADDPDARARLGRRAAEKVRAQHDIEVAAPRLAAELRSLLGAGSAPHGSPHGTPMTDTAETPPRLIAFHLPQFHPIPENDGWWGRGFTEWTNVTRARPLFRGHYQPHLPADLGFYDLRLPEARAAQADLARRYGVHGFCYYHYWFNGRRLLERPVNEILASGEPDFPFCLCWANEPWSRNWDGSNRLVLVEQKYSPEDDVNHVRWLLPAFADRRYIRVGGKPLFLVYHVTHLTDPQRTTDRWRDEARKAGVGDLHLATVQSHGKNHVDPRPLGFDTAVEFAPDTNNFPDKYGVFHRVRGAVRRNLVGVSYKLWKGVDWSLEKAEGATGAAAPRVRTYRDHRVFSYPDVVAKMLAKPDPGYPMFRGVCPSWDNAARRKTGATVFADSTPELYEGWLREIVSRHRAAGKGDEPIFLNAWNEWAEGCHLEPDQKWGRGYLEATARAVGHPVPGGAA